MRYPHLWSVCLLCASLTVAGIQAGGASSGAPKGRPDLLFTSPNSKGGEQGQPHIDVFSMNLDSSGRRNLTRNALDEYDPALSPDGKQMAFAGYHHVKDRNSNLYVMEIGGARPQRLTNNRVGMFVEAPSWSPDGKRIVFTRVRLDLDKWTGFPSELWMVDRDGTPAKRIGYGALPSWSPDGRKILYTWRSGRGKNAGVGLFVTDPEGRNPRVLSLKGEEGVWSPDGKRIAYLTTLGKSRTGGFFVRGIGVMEADGSKARIVAKAEGWTGGIRWTPDGRHLFFTLVKSLPLAVPQYPRIYAVNLQGKGKRAVTGEKDWCMTGRFGLGSLIPMISLYEYEQKSMNSPPP